MHFDLTDMRLFLHIVETGSITKGAERAHLALASASARIRGLEEDLRTPLLVRGRRGVETTHAGRTFAHHARIVLQQVGRMMGELAEYGGGIQARIRLLCNTSALAEHLPSALNAFMTKHPNVAIDLEEHLSYEIVRAVSRGMADIGVVADTVELNGLEVLPFRPDRLVLVVPARHSLAVGTDRRKKRTVSFGDVLEHDFIGMAGDSALQQYLNGQALRIGKRMKYRILLRSFEAICQLVENGAGIAIVPESAARRCEQTMAIRHLALEEAWADRQLLICVRSFESLGSHVKQLVSELRG